MKELFALQGSKNTGKTTTIGLLFEEMKSSDYAVVIDKIKKDSKDFFVIVENDGIRIGISTYGDTERQIKGSIKFFMEHSCEVIICACRTKGATVQALYGHGYEVSFVRKTVSKNKKDSEENRKNNTKDVGRLISKVKKKLPN